MGVPVLTKREVLAGAAAACLAAVPLAVLAAGRTYLTYGTENDFLGQYLPEAQRILDGIPLRIRFHPPLYPFVLAVARRVGGDWFTAGLVVSWLAAVISMVAAYLLFAVLRLRWAAWGALAALATSPIFVSFSAQATSDIFFLALYLSALCALVMASQHPTRAPWAVAGLLVGLAVLTRTNGVTLVPVAIVAAMGRTAEPSRRVPGWPALATLAAVLLLWVGIARVTESPAWPRGNIYNLALTYFAPGTDRISYEGFEVAASRTDELATTWREHPAQILVVVAKTYLRDGLRTVRQLGTGDGFLLFPLSALALPGLLLLFAQIGRPVRRLLGIALVLQALLLNLKTFEPRYWLSMVPFLGAGAAITLQLVLQQLGSPTTRRALAAALGLLTVLELTRSVRAIESELHATDAELSEAVPAMRELVRSDTAPAVVLSRKPLLAYYSGALKAPLPPVHTPDELLPEVARYPGRPVYVFLGLAERSYRPELVAALMQDDSRPAWLTPAAKSQVPGQWALLRVTRPD